MTKPTGNRAKRRARVDPRLKKPGVNGRPAHVPTNASRGLVRMLLLLGRTHDEISTAAGIDDKTLRKHYRAEIDTTRETASAGLMQTLMLKAMGGSGEQARWQDADVRSLHFALERVAGLKAPAQRHLVGNFDLAKLRNLTDEQLAQFEDLIAIIAPDGGDPSGEDEA